MKEDAVSKIIAEENAMDISEAELSDRGKRISKSMMIASMMGYMGLSESEARAARLDHKSIKKPCLNCGKMKIHRNSFCSAECCKTYGNKNK